MNRLRSGLAATALVAAAGACGPPADADPRMVSEWMHLLYGAVRAERLSPPVASRFLAYAGAALHEGLAAARGGEGSLAGALRGLAPVPVPEGGATDPTVVAVVAEKVVLDSLLAEALPTTRASVGRLADSLLALRTTLGEGIRARSRALGERVGLVIVAWARTDRFAATRGRPYRPPVGPGLWLNDSPGSTYAAQNLSPATDFVGLDNPANTIRPGTAGDRGLVLSRSKRPGLKELPPVNMAGATEPYWGEVRPFVLERWDECPIDPPPGYGTEPGSPLRAEAEAVMETKARLTPEQRTIALYWADNPGESGTPSGHWIAITSQLVSQRGLSAAAAARAFAVVAAAQADAFIAAWGYKYHYNLIRPRTYIRRVLDPSWEPLIPTPPFPEYPAGHATQSAAAARVLAGLLGEMAFEDSTSLALGHEVRRFASFEAAADEAGASRIYGGIHFPAGNAAGKALGRCIGERTVGRADGRTGG